MASASLQAGELRTQPAPSGVVSLEQLRSPLEGRALHLVEKAQHLLRAGQRDKGLEVLRRALREPSAYPYAISLMGAEHLKMGDLANAVPELETAVALLPADPANHANLAYALGFRGGSDELALKEARRALQLDPGRSRTRFILGQILLRMGQREEAKFHLTKAAAELAGARDLLARCFAD